MNCSNFKRWLFHFQADEVPAEERAALQAHLDGCTDCARRLELEDGLLEGLRARIPRVPAPPGLETRIKARLDGLVPARKVSWFRRPAVAALAASLMLAVLMLPGLETPGIPVRPTEAGSVIVDGEEVVVVDVDCDRAGRGMARQRGCSMHHHLNAFKTKDGNYWNISLDREAHRRLLVNREIRGHRLRVEGTLYPHLQTLQMTGYEDLGPIPL